MIAGALVLADGSTFEGEMFGAPQGIASGEVVFNTALTGYQEVLSDPSYAGQIITFTYPHIGNYGVTDADNESSGSFARGVIVRDLTRRHSNFRATDHLETFLRDRGLAGIGGIDTRRLTRILRTSGALPGAFGPTEGEHAVDEAGLKQAAAAEPGTAGVDLVAQVTTAAPYRVESTGPSDRLIVAYDFGIKTSIIQHLSSLGTVEIVPATTSAADVLARNPAGVFLSNGPGDPEMVPTGIAAVQELIDQVPIFGICLGHQILSLAVGGSVEKLSFGHHGANHPVRDETTGKVEITSQNHNFAVLGESISDVADVTHINLNDGVCEGMALREAPAFSVQHHPEASPGPHDSLYLFDRFDELMTRKAN
ncbi:MAG: carbamoyl-phosphate synthase small subunit [Acidimicrobiales bacterium]|jgi:carbamoyl-phosphate synthase small subunit